MANAVTNSFEADREHHNIDRPVNIVPIIPLKLSKRNLKKYLKQSSAWINCFSKTRLLSMGNQHKSFFLTNWNLETEFHFISPQTTQLGNHYIAYLISSLFKPKWGEKARRVKPTRTLCTQLSKLNRFTLPAVSCNAYCIFDSP